MTGIVYLQVTRGVAPRDHAFPKSAKPTLVVTSRASRPPDPRHREDGIAVITIPDIRWQRCDIKSIALVANVLGKQQAREAGVFEAWQVDGDGRITEGTSTNAWIVTGDATVVTRAADNAILNGVTRLAVLDIIAREGYRLDERPFTVEEAKAAREAFLTSTTADLLPVVRIDGAPVGDGKPGPLEPQTARRRIWRTRRSRHDDFADSPRRRSLGLRPPRAILFDWDNTLVDSWATIHEALNFLMRAMDKPEWSLAETREKVRLSLRESFPLHFGDRWEEARDIYLDAFRAIHLERLTPLPGREAMLRNAGGAGDLSRGGQQQDRRRCCGEKSRGSAGRTCSAASSEPATRRSTSRRASRSTWRWQPSGVPAGRRGMVCRRYRGRYGMRREQRLCRGFARRSGACRGVCPGIRAFCAPAVLRGRGEPVSLAGGLADRGSAPIFVGERTLSFNA